jgi:hypothetical protein
MAEQKMAQIFEIKLDHFSKMDLIVFNRIILKSISPFIKNLATQRSVKTMNAVPL